MRARTGQTDPPYESSFDEDAVFRTPYLNGDDWEGEPTVQASCFAFFKLLYEHAGETPGYSHVEMPTKQFQTSKQH